jgi:tetratricopeptide (TPR) repeat protein
MILAMANARDEGKLERIGRLLLALELALAGLALGSLHTGVLAVVAALAMAAAGCLWFDAEPMRARPAATTLVVLASVLLGWTTLQAIPLPASFVAAVAPENADVWARSLSPLHEPGPAWVTLSLDPQATRVEVLRGVTYLLTLLAALRVARRHEGVVFLERVVVAAAVAMAVAAALHPAFGAERVLGFYEPVNKHAFAPKNFAPLLNTNHLAAYVNVGFCVAFASALRRHEPPLPRPIAAAAAAVLAATNLWARSRGGAGGLVLGALVIAGLTLYGQRRERGRALLALAPSVGVVLAAVMATLAWSEEARNKLVHTNTDKLGIPVQALALVKKSALTGVGRGAFESVFPSVREGTGHWVFSHPENVLAQFGAEWGVPFALLAVVAIVWALRPASMLARSHPPAGPWTALVVVALQNFVDFSSEVPGVVILGIACAAIVVGGTAGRRSTSRLETWSSRPRLLLGGTALALALALAVTLPGMTHELGAEQRRFELLGVDRALGREAFLPEARAAMLRHPAEPYFAFVGALRASVVGDDAVLPWAARALERSPISGRTHLLLARSLWTRHPAQARLEYRLGFEQDPALLGLASKEIPSLVAELDDALELAPGTKEGAAVLEGLVTAVESRLPATASRIDAAILLRDPLAIEPQRRRAAAALADLRDGAAWCGPAGADCLVEGDAAARRVRETGDAHCEGHVLVARLAVAAGQVERGIDGLEKATDISADKVACAKALVSIALELGQRSRADAALDRFTRLGCASSTECVDNLVFAAVTEQSRGNTRKALAHYKAAAERAPERDDLLETVAGIATAQGLPGEALEVFTRLAQRNPGEPKYAQGASNAREALQKSYAGRREVLSR